MIICEGAFALIFLAIRFYLVSENSRRDREQSDDQFDDAYVVVTDDKGMTVKEKVDRVSAYLALCPQFITDVWMQAFLDLTDKQNRDFRYVL